MLYTDEISKVPTLTDVWLAMQDNGFYGDWFLMDTAEIGGEEFMLVARTNIKVPNGYTGFILDSNCNVIICGVDCIEECRESLELHTQPVDKMPDESLTFNDMDCYGYHWHGMLPVSEETAKRLFARLSVFALYGDETESQVINENELQALAKSDVMFGIEKSEWLGMR